MSKSDASSPDKLVDRENSACSVDTVESYSGKDGKGKDKGRQRGGELKKLFSLPENEVVSQVQQCNIQTVRSYLCSAHLYKLF